MFQRLRKQAHFCALGILVSVVSVGLDNPSDLTFGPDGNLYVSGGASHDVVRFDGSDGTFIDVYVDQTGNSLVSPKGITFVPGHQVTVVDNVAGAISDTDVSTNEVNESVADGTAVAAIRS